MYRSMVAMALGLSIVTKLLWTAGDQVTQNTMSIFKVKHLWSNEKLQSEEYSEGIQSSCCIKVDKFSSHNTSDCIVVGEGQQLKIYKPNVFDSETDVILESQLDDIILQIETGKFITDSGERQILVLHPQSYAVYTLERRDGHVDEDGSLSFFDQDTFLFLCVFHDVIIPGPVCYIASSDLFVICKSTWILEIYSYQQLREFEEISIRTNKKCIPQWTYNPGEEILSVQVIRTSNNFSNIITLGERYLYCFQDNGLMKHMIRFDFVPVCFHAYLIGWYYEPNTRLLIMVASEDSKLYVYEETTLLWSCDLLLKTIALSRCFLKNISGGLVTLSTRGIVHVSCLGTKPDLNSNIVSMNNDAEPLNMEDLKYAEDKLRRVMGDEDEIDDQSIKENFSISVEIGKPFEKVNYGITEVDDDQSLFQCPVITVLNFEDPKQWQNLQITYTCSYPFKISDSTIFLENINGTEIIETYVFVSNNFDVSNTAVTVMCTITDCVGKMYVFDRIMFLPLILYAYPVEASINNACKVEFSSERKFNPETISTNKTVTLKTTQETYVVEASDFTEIGPLLDYILHKIQKNNNDIEDFSSDELDVLQSQFMAIQKELLVQYGSLPPGDCDPLEFLMRDTYRMIVSTSQTIINTRESVQRATCELSSIGNLIQLILKYTNKNDFRLKILEETLSFDTFQNDIQEWEESVTQAFKYMINNVLKKSEKDKEKLSLLSDQDILSQTNIKKFIRQIRLILESIFTTLSDEVEDEKKITRIEEFVELI
ncbi:unnamed protein product [Leptidea sinapis]|uniref:PTHB1 N-terminal domain-containing protein n=1 Tax=Leptidea sinapis TaxID=189913 RepID=A0A5E4QY23_9NEOP|nr:unnamed protein product [Leptidea sinapis]